jgi:hypothetical protein
LTPLALTNALHALLYDEERARNGQHSRRMAEERYQWHDVMESWRALWDKLETTRAVKQLSKPTTPRLCRATGFAGAIPTFVP